MNNEEKFEDMPMDSNENQQSRGWVGIGEQERLLKVPKDLNKQIETLRMILNASGDTEVAKTMEVAQNKVNWAEFETEFLSVSDPKLRLKILTTTFERSIRVYKDAFNSDTSNKDESEFFHRKYTVHDDSILHMALRRSAPDYILDMFSITSPLYGHSRNLFNRINTITLEDEEWVDIHETIDQIAKESVHDYSESTDLNIEEQRKNNMKYICEIRHTWREDTLLSTSSRRDPPLSIIQTLIDYAPKTLSMFDTPRYDWMPFVYSLAYNAKPEVVKALIPSSDCIRETGVLVKKDVYDLTPIHWSLFYGAPVESVRSLVNADESKESLTIPDSKNKVPYQMAISNTTDMAIVEALLPPNEKMEDVERGMVRSIIGLESSIYKNVVQYEVSPRTYRTLAAKIAKKPILQNMLRFQSAGKVATMMTISEFYVKIMFIVCFHNISHAYISRDQERITMESEEMEETSLLRDEMTSFVLLCFAFTYAIFRELRQMINTGLPYLGDPWNLWDDVFIILSAMSTFMMVLQDEKRFPFLASRIQGIILINLAMAWSNLLFFLRSVFLPFAVFISGLIGVFITLIPFTFGVVVILLAFAQLYMTEQVNTQQCNVDPSESEPSDLCKFDTSFLFVYDMFVGGIALEEELKSSSSMLILSATFGFIVAILLLNIVIAIVSDKWAEVYANGAEHYWRNRLEFLAEVKGFDKIFGCFIHMKSESRGSDTFWNKMVNTTYDIVVKICNMLWPRKDFWGYFDHIIDRVCSTKPLYGSFLWQFDYEWKAAKNLFQKAVLLVKGLLLIIFFSAMLLLWFVGGVLTCGAFWPRTMRKALLGHFILTQIDEDDEGKRMKKVAQNQSDLLHRLQHLEDEIKSLKSKGA